MCKVQCHRKHITTASSHLYCLQYNNSNIPIVGKIFHIAFSLIAENVSDHPNKCNYFSNFRLKLILIIPPLLLPGLASMLAEGLCSITAPGGGDDLFCAGNQRDMWPHLVYIYMTQPGCLLYQEHLEELVLSSPVLFACVSSLSPQCPACYLGTQRTYGSPPPLSDSAGNLSLLVGPTQS